MALKRALAGVVPEDLLDRVPTSFEIVGSRAGAVAILEIPPELEQYKHAIAQAVRGLNRNIGAVLRRIGRREGPYRLYSYEVLVEGSTEVLHREHGYVIKVDPTKVYFSPRDQTDRMEIASQVAEGERVLYLFAGAAPYAVAIARHARPRHIVAVELNPWGFKYAVENMRLNKVRNAAVIHGDVAEVHGLLLDSYDRVLMTLPLGAHRFLPLAIRCIDGEGHLHFYHLGPQEDPFGEAERIVEEACPRCVVVGRRVVRDYAPRVHKVRLDVYVRRT